MLPADISQQFRNDQEGIAYLIRWARPHQPSRVLFEATGPYHRALETAFGRVNLSLVTLNPWQACRFAEPSGKRAKTDAVNAATPPRWHALAPCCVPSPNPSGTKRWPVEGTALGSPESGNEGEIYGDDRCWKASQGSHRCHHT